MTRKAQMLAMSVLLVAAYCTQGHGQVMPSTILEVDVVNAVNYQEDISDISKFATDPNVTPQVPQRNFALGVSIGDIVAVNGQPARGTVTQDFRRVLLRSAAGPGQAIADTVRNDVIAGAFEILKSDGTPIGTIVSYGLTGGSPPPGAPLSMTQDSFPIVGGTGAFLGARGVWGRAVTPQTVAARSASVTEDPANRRRNGGGRGKYVLQVIPMSVPQIVATATGPAITHSSDFALVTASKPAAAGEILSAFVTGLGPTKPGVDPGKPFPSNPLVAVNSPVEVTVNGKSAEVTAAVGYPGAVDGYQVNFRVPSDAAKGTATVQVSAAWIAGPAVSIAIQ
jgi:uncharacterized protein (TIGR03437 family)